MITIHEQQELIDKIKSLSELELQALFDELADHFYTNKLEHIVGDGWEMLSLQNEIEDLHDALQTLKTDNAELATVIKRIKDICNDIS